MTELFWITASNTVTAEASLNQYLTDLHRFFQTWGILINIPKSFYTVFSRDPSIRLNIVFDSKPLQLFTSPSLLGLTYDPKLRFHDHILSIQTKALRRLNMMRRFCGLSWGPTSHTLLVFYKSFIRPLFEFCAEIFSTSASKKDLRLLDRLQSRCIRIALGSTRTTPNYVLYSESAVEPLKHRREKLILKKMYRISALQYLSNLRKQSYSIPILSVSKTFHSIAREVHSRVFQNHPIGTMPPPRLPDTIPKSSQIAVTSTQAFLKYIKHIKFYHSHALLSEISTQSSGKYSQLSDHQPDLSFGSIYHVFQDESQ